MALQDNALTTVSAVEAELGLSSGTDTAYLERQINAYSDLFEQATDRRWYRDDSYTESIKSFGDTRLMVHDHLPVRSVSQVDVKGDTVDAADYSLESGDQGLIRLDNDFWESTAVGVRNVERYVKYHELRVDVTYDGGYVTPKQEDDGTFSPRDLPHDIEQAVILSVANKYRQKGQPSNIRSQSISSDSASVEYVTSNTERAYGQAVASAFTSAVQRYQDRSVL